MKIILSALFIISSIMFIYFTSSPIPIVYWSTSQDKCVNVKIKSTSYNCNELINIERYEIIWTE